MHGLGLAPGLIRHDPWNIKLEAITLLYSQSNYGFELAALTARVGRGPYHVLRSMNSHLEGVLLIIMDIEFTSMLTIVVKGYTTTTSSRVWGTEGNGGGGFCNNYGANPEVGNPEHLNSETIYYK